MLQLDQKPEIFKISLWTKRLPPAPPVIQILVLEVQCPLIRELLILKLQPFFALENIMSCFGLFYQDLRMF